MKKQAQGWQGLKVCIYNVQKTYVLFGSQKNHLSLRKVKHKSGIYTGNQQKLMLAKDF